MKLHDHVELLGVLFAVWGFLTAVIGLSTLALGAGAVVMAFSSAAPAREVAAGLIAALFILLGAIAVAWGVGHVLVGRGLRRRRPRARLAAIMLGLVDLLLLPYGTVLGGYALWVLLAARGTLSED